MLKKILLLALPVAALAVLSFQVTSADYYDCQGILREGRPGPSECRQLRTPPELEQTEPQDYNYSQPPRLTRLCGNVPCDEPQRIDPATPTERPDPDLDIRKVRKYCVREYCYIIYEICDSSGHCTEEAKRVPREDFYDYERPQNDWRESLNNYTYNYIYNNYNTFNFYNSDYFNDCRFYTRGCVYRGTYYGRYHNRYWDF